MDSEELIELLKQRISTFAGLSMDSPGDFANLQEKIFRQTRKVISTTTLRRFWGVQERGDGFGRSKTTIAILCSFLGFDSFEKFKQSLECCEKDSGSSDFVLDCPMLVTSDLTVGDEVRVCWEPQRELTLVFDGHDVFHVKSSINGKLKEGDVLRCQQFVNGEKLFCKSVRREGMPVMDYVCGKNGGIRFCRL